MPYSHPETKSWVVQKIMQLDNPTILDVGAGAGMWYDYLTASHFTGTIDAIEVWGRYISEFSLMRKYRIVYNRDVRNWSDFDYDVVILGDVLEHMTKDEAVALVEKISKSVNYIAIAIPIIHFPQGSVGGNPYEVHIKDDWSHEEVLNTFTNIVDYKVFTATAAYWLCYNS